MSMSKLLPIIFLTAILVIGIPYVVIIMGATDAGVDLSGTDYEEQYESTTETSIATVTILQFMAFVLGVVALVVSIGFLKKRKGF